MLNKRGREIRAFFEAGGVIHVKRWYEMIWRIIVERWDRFGSL